MAVIDHREYLVGDSIKELTSEKTVKSLSKEEEERIIALSNKQRALRSKGFIITDTKGNILFEEKKQYSQHFFPLSVLDYVAAMYNFERHKKPIPILSFDSHDVLQCDFNCHSCLSAHGTNFPLKDFPKDNFKMDLAIYKKILKEIGEYSRSRGFNRVRFEQSGEGNPDYYLNRKEILRYASELGMQSVYVSTGSKIDDSLREELIENASFIRISFPGIGDSYKYYSGQKGFTFKDALDGIKRILVKRKQRGRENDLMIGARVALRDNHGDTYFNFANELKNMGIDSLQIVKLLVPEGKRPSEFPIKSNDYDDLNKARELNDRNFNIHIPHKLDSMVYSREIESRSDFPEQCFSARFQPVLAGRSMFVCTISNIMYSNSLRLGTFTYEEGDLERFLSEDNLLRVTREIPSSCKSCPSIYDNILLFSLQKLFRSNNEELNFYEIIK